ncbi:hypothetical protein F4825DRAFT_410851 [Nemania diffusa]|nr:hypothetical protein F4825DRAFT_410851 [Nemania diffusa]
MLVSPPSASPWGAMYKSRDVYSRDRIWLCVTAYHSCWLLFCFILASSYCSDSVLSPTTQQQSVREEPLLARWKMDKPDDGTLCCTG